MTQLSEYVDLQINELNTSLKRLKKIVRQYPEGSLRLRFRKDRPYLAIAHKFRSGYKEESITKNPDMISTYINKYIDIKLMSNIEHNLKLLKNISGSLKPTDRSGIIASLPQKLQTAAEMFNHQQKGKNCCLNYDAHCFRDIDHKHATNCGIWVRSKDEAFICNKFCSYGITFRYEPCLVLNGNYYYPDFIIVLPNGDEIVWEHFGMLDDIDYVNSNAQKLYDYFTNGIVLGRNFIATFDDPYHTFDQARANKIIAEQIAPLFF